MLTTANVHDIGSVAAPFGTIKGLFGPTLTCDKYFNSTGLQMQQIIDLRVAPRRSDAVFCNLSLP